MDDRRHNKTSISSDPAHALGRTVAVVVTFCPDLEVLHRQFSRLSEEGIRSVVVDNASVEQAEVSALADKFGLDFVALPRNLGVAGAQNAGLDRVKLIDSCEYVVFMDQDSVPEKGTFLKLLEDLFGVERLGKVAAVGSSYTLPSGKPGSSFVRFSWFRFLKLSCQDSDEKVHPVDFLISSGTLFKLSALDDVGFMKSELFIDHVDTEWFLRARSRGYLCFGSCRAHMNHALGEHTIRFWLGRWRTVPVHKGFRYYFMFRNSIWLYRQSYAPGKWISADVMRLIYIFVFSGLLVSTGIGNIKWMIKGLRDGFRSPGRWQSERVVSGHSAAAE